MNKKIIIGIVTAILILILGIGAFSLLKPKAKMDDKPSDKQAITSKPVNIIPVKDRPFVTIQPLTSRNLIEFTVHNLPKKAKELELVLEYDRNKGVMDAIFQTYDVDGLPLVKELFFGSKSGGGHTTYHDDVIGGKMILDFSDDDYTLEVPWRYTDTESSYTQLSTSDAKFQMTLEEPIRKSKTIVMESPGVPVKIKGELISGIYYISTVGDLPETSAEVTIRLSEEAPEAIIYGWNGDDWIEFETTIDGKTATATVDLVQVYIATK